MINILIEELMFAELWPVYALMFITLLYFIIWSIIKK